VCSNEASFNMLALLGGSPDVGGSWIGPTGDPQPGVFTPGMDPAGCYTYIVAGLPPCVNDTSVLCITVVPAPIAGTGGSLTVCSSDAPFNMFAALGGSPQVGGSWMGPNGA